MMSKKQKHASELMPNDELSVQILKKRAQQLAQPEQDSAESNGISYVRFSIRTHECYGIPYHYVQEILPETTLVKPPFVPSFIAGVLNWRGALVSIVDLVQFFHPQHAERHSDKQFIIIIHANNITLGLLTHHIEGSDRFQPERLAKPLSSGNVADPEYILGLHHAVTAILNVEAFISGLNQETKKVLYRIGEVHGHC